MEIYKTTDLGLSASLLAYGFKLSTIDRSDPRRVIFIFEDSTAIRQAASDYWNDSLLISGYKQMDYIKKLKGRIYSP